MSGGPNDIFFFLFQSNVFSISLDNGSVVLNAKGVKVQTVDRPYNDGKAHFVITSASPERYNYTI